MSIRRYESGERIITDEILERIADALGFHIFDLTGIGKELDKYTFELEIPPDATQEDIEQMRMAFDGKTAKDIYDELSGEEKKIFLKIWHDYNTEVEQVARDYNSLDQWGQQAVRAVISVEKARMRGAEGKDTPAPEPPPETAENGG